MTKKSKKLPVAGEKVYVPSSWYVYRGADDFQGGIATISKIHKSNFLPKDHENYLMISIEERPNYQYNWLSLMDKQEEYKNTYGDEIAHPDPDYAPEFNDDNEGWH